MCGDPDIITYSVYSDLAWDRYFGNTSLIDEASGRYEEVSGWKLGAPLSHIPTIALDYLYEATIAHAFGLYRSAIFCCAGVLDLELKRNLIDEFPRLEEAIRKETFGRSIGRYSVESNDSNRKHISERLEFVNKVRNRLSVHPSSSAGLTRCIEDNKPFLSDPDQLQDFLEPDDLKAGKVEGAGGEVVSADLFKALSEKVIWETKSLIGEHGF